MTTRKTGHIIPVRSSDSDSAVPAETIGLQTILDNLDAMVYVADFETHELLYMNAYGRKVWGEFQKGQKCWKVLQNNDGPCSFCTNHLLINRHGEAAGTHVWEFRNEVDERWY